MNLRADAADIDDRIELLVDEGVKVASFAQAPTRGADRDAARTAASLVDAVDRRQAPRREGRWSGASTRCIVQGGEGGGHTGSVPTTLLLPQVVDAVAGPIPVIAAGGFFDGRGLVAALAYGADGIAMGTRFLLTRDSRCPTR